ncbi:MAG: tetratricopeptide repeat protein [Alsobacter sp.]|nr:tetratricopeptide repeat protein [Burkholderiales bacterium]
MADIFREVEEDVRRDRALAFWKKYGNVLIALALLAVAGTAAWRGWVYWQTKQSEAAGARYEQAIEDSKAGRSEEADKELQALASGGARGYEQLSRLRLAAELGKSDLQAALKAYDGIVADTGFSTLMRDIARLRAGMLVADTAPLAELKTRLDPLLAPGSALGANARELLGLAALKAGDYEAAGKWLDEIITDQAAPASLRQRADLLLAIVRAGPVKPAS